MLDILSSMPVRPPVENAANGAHWIGLVTKFGQISGLLLFCLTFSTVTRACPDLSPYYLGDQADWNALERELLNLTSECLESSEFFALLGAAQLNNNKVPASLESLERALLLEPQNGAAQIDYARALFQQGDLFAALELNRNILLRNDLPVNLVPLLEERQRTWQSFTRQQTFNLDLLAGYDSNLNTAPESSQITLTLSGEPVVLELNPEFQPTEGAYINFRLGARLRQLRPGYQNNWRLEASGRASEDQESDLLQLDAGYAMIRPGRNSSLQVSTALTHLFFGGNPLYTASEAIVRYQPRSTRQCNPYYDLALQYQLFHERSQLNALESKLGAGLSCPLQIAGINHQFIMEAGLLNNFALDGGRPGDDRNGFQANLVWQVNLGMNEFRSQLSYTEIRDHATYSPLLADGARREIDRSFILLQYRRPASDRATILVNIFHQDQRSNLQLFTNSDTSVEFGFSYRL